MTIKGYTLIEVLIALAVFALLAVMTSSALQQTLGLNQRLKAHMAQWDRFTLSIHRVNQHIHQMVARGVRGNDGIPIQNFVGKKDYVEFTRGGYFVSKDEKKQSSLSRIALFCLKDKLVERRWPVLDSINRKQYQDHVLLTQLTRCHFDFLSQHLEWLSPWRANMHPDKSQNALLETLLLPKAVRLTIATKALGGGQFIFINPIGNYVD